MNAADYAVHLVGTMKSLIDRNDPGGGSSLRLCALTLNANQLQVVQFVHLFDLLLVQHNRLCMNELDVGTCGRPRTADPWV